MPENQTFTIGEREFPIPSFKLRQVQTLIPFFSSGGMETPAQMSSMITAVHEAVKSSEPEMTFAEMQDIPGVTVPQLLTAYQKIGLAIGYFRAKASAAPGGEGDAQ